MPIGDCGHILEYVGSHYDEEEGWCSSYVCKTCKPVLVRRYKKAWQSHLYRCNNVHCERCGGEGYRKKHKEEGK